MSSPRQSSHPIDPLFLQRWSPRAFTGETLDEAQLLGLLEAARWAPSAFNAQPWRFAWALRDTAGWSRIFNTLIEFNQGWVKTASALVVVLSRTSWTPPGKAEPQPIGSHAFDAGAAWAQLALQATRSGLAAHGMTGFNPAALREALAIPEDLHINAVIAIGRPGDKTQLPEALQAREQPSDRLPLAQLAFAVPAEGAVQWG